MHSNQMCLLSLVSQITYPSASALSKARFLAFPRILILLRGCGVAGIRGQLKDSGVAIIHIDGNCGEERQSE